MIAWFAKNGVAANLLMGVILVAGFFSVRNLKMEMFPEFDLDLITVTTLYPGAAPAKWRRECASKSRRRYGILQG